MRPWDTYWPDGPLPIETSRKGWGRIAIANSDAGAYAYAHSAIDQAGRAVKDLLGDKANIAGIRRFPGATARQDRPLTASGCWCVQGEVARGQGASEKIT